MADPRFGDERYDRYRQDDYRAEDYRGNSGRYDERSNGGRNQGGYGGGQEDRTFSGGGRDFYTASAYGGSYGEEGSRDRNSGSSDYGRGGYGQNDKPWYGRSGYSRHDYNAASNGPGAYGRQYTDDRYNDRSAAGAMLHQGYRSPFGDRSDFNRNEFRQYDGEGQRYQYNDYQPTHDQAGRYAHAGAGYGAGYGAGQDRGFWDQTRDEVSSWFGDDQAKQRRQLDGVRADHHGGKGPKGYTRSDDRIREDLNDRLTDDYSLDASDIEVKVDKGEVTLTGQVSSRTAKRRAEDVADAIGGVKHVQNNLRVKDQADSASSAYASQGGVAQTAGATSAVGTSAARSN